MAIDLLCPLPDAIRRHVEPGMHLHFAASPSRSNAAVRELARVFLDRRPGFVLSSTGFHSSAHALPLLGLGQRYVACFFGDNYPAPRPNGLYRALAREGLLEHWSLLSYTLALRAGALGHPYAVTTSLAETDLGAALAERGRLFQVPDPAGGREPVRLLAPMIPDVTFLHAAVATRSGRALFPAPCGEGFHGAHAARRGVIVTAEKIVEEHELEHFAHLVALPAARVLAVAEEPFGAHPQPLFLGSEVCGVTGYGDDFAAYEAWRAFAERPERFAAYRRAVLEAADGRQAYFDFVGQDRLEALRASAAPNQTVRASERAAQPPSRALGASERLVLLAARTILRHLNEAGHRSILAGIGQSFSASRLALLLDRATAEAVELLVETGISGFEASEAHPFLLSAHNMAAAARLSSVEDNLGAVACGRHNRCLAVVGCAEADADGNLNSSFVNGELIVGSGGASDLTACAREAVVLCKSDRLVAKVEFVTSPGTRVRAIVTEDGVLERRGPEYPWELTSFGLGARSAAEFCAALPFHVRVREAGAAPPVTGFELDALAEVLRAGARDTRVENGGHNA
ncbi:MAG TPA: CoA-transferase [Polyangiaceae bacterium]|nr:CoA-transferase [Polyangiaceae bacterium]